MSTNSDLPPPHGLAPSETMVSIPLQAQKTLEIKGFLGLERPLLDLVSQTPRPRGRGLPLFAEQMSTNFLNSPSNMCTLSAPHRCNANRSDAQRRFLATQVISPIL